MRSFTLSGLAILPLLLGTSTAQTTGDRRWKGFCIDGTKLPKPATDAAVTSLVNWAGNGNAVQSSATQNTWHYENNGGVTLYACVDAYNDKFIFSNNHVHAALAAMDSNCPAYQPSWAILEQFNGFTWQATSAIVGKAWQGTPICQGTNGGMGNCDLTGGNTIAYAGP